MISLYWYHCTDITVLINRNNDTVNDGDEVISDLNDNDQLVVTYQI